MGLQVPCAQLLPDGASRLELLTEVKIETEATALLVNEESPPPQDQGRVQHQGLAPAQLLSIHTFRVYQILVQMVLRRQLPQHFDYGIPLQAWATMPVLKHQHALKPLAPTTGARPSPNTHPLLKIHQPRQLQFLAATSGVRRRRLKRRTLLPLNLPSQHLRLGSPKKICESPGLLLLLG